MRDNEVVDVVDSFLHYQANSEPGSSGSPVFNDQGELTLLVSGDVWDGSRAQIPLIRWVANEGVRISSMVAHLSDRRAN